MMWQSNGVVYVDSTTFGSRVNAAARMALDVNHAFSRRNAAPAAIAVPTQTSSDFPIFSSFPTFLVSTRLSEL